MLLRAGTGLLSTVCHCTRKRSSRGWGDPQPSLLAWSHLQLDGTLQGLGPSTGVSIRVILFHYLNQKIIFFPPLGAFQEPAGDRILFALLAPLGM